MIHLITYGDQKYENAKKRICNEAKNTGWFDSITPYGPNDLDNKFKQKFKNILSLKRGGGYWIWKSHIIKKKLKEINDNDFLIYLDAGCVINKKGKDRFFEYIKLLKNSDKGIISFQMNHIEKTYTTKEIFDYFDVDLNSDIANSGQIIGGIRIMKKNKHLINIINLESKVLYDNPLLFTDHYNKKQADFFKDNRHEQSIFSLIRKIHGSIILDDETWFKIWSCQKAKKMPFLAKRQRR